MSIYRLRAVLTIGILILLGLTAFSLSRKSDSFSVVRLRDGAVLLRDDDVIVYDAENRELQLTNASYNRLTDDKNRQSPEQVLFRLGNQTLFEATLEYLTIKNKPPQGMYADMSKLGSLRFFYFSSNNDKPDPLKQTLLSSYFAARSKTGTIEHESNASFGYDRQKDLEEEKKMPWYKDVKNSTAIYSEQHAKDVAVSGNLSAEHATLLLKSSPAEQLDILLQDFALDRHYEFSLLFNDPASATDFISAIQAGNWLVALARAHPELQPSLIKRLVTLATSVDAKYPDQMRGAAIYFLGKIVPEDQKFVIKTQIQPYIRSGGNFSPRSYTEFYVDQWD